MSIANNKTGELWKSFMPRRKEILHPVASDFYSLQLYDPLYFSNFNPQKEFEKWALLEVTDFDTIPSEMKTFTLLGRFYAIFIHKGDTTAFSEALQFILGTWLPNSGFVLDDRPHFEVLGQKYKNNDPNSEEVWIPISSKE